jgi:hypothetical protein
MDEILVHIGAPATRQNDDLYRSLANAYHEFEPQQPSEPAATASRGDESGLASTEYPSFGASFQENAIHGTPNPSTSIASRDSYGSFPSRFSPEKRPVDVKSFPPQISFDSFDDSFLDSSRLAQLERIQQKSKQNEGSEPSFVRHQRIPDDTDFIEDTQLGAQALQSQLPDIFSDTSEDTSDDEEQNLSQNRNELPPSSPWAGRDVTDQAVGATPASQLSVGAGITQQDIPWTATSSPSIFPATVSLTPTMTSQHFDIEKNDSTQETIDFSKFPCEVFSPAPKVSMHCPGRLPSQITPYLKALKRQNPRRFKHQRKARTLKADERGYWLVETATWPQKTQLEFWTSLCKQVQSGSFGWGVFLYREPQASSSAESRADSGLGQVRLYAWGELIEEIWLALWLSSDGKISGSGSRWLDAGDAVIFQVS